MKKHGHLPQSAAQISGFTLMIPSWLRGYPGTAGRIVVSISLIVILGWTLHLPVLTSLIPSQPPMQPVTALTFLLCGGALLLTRQDSKPRAAYWAAAGALTAGLIVLLSLLQYVMGMDWSIGDWIWGQRDSETIRSHKMSLHTSIAFLPVVGALLAQVKTRNGWRLGQPLAVITGFIVLLVTIGYIYRYTWLYTLDGYTGMSLPTVAAFGVLSLGLLVMEPERGLMALTLSQSAGGILLRHLLPITIAIIVMLGGLRLVGEHVGLYNTSMGTTLMITLLILLISLSTLHVALQLNSLEQSLQMERLWLRQTLVSIADAVIATDPQGRVLFMNPSAETLTGWSHQDSQHRDLREVFRTVNEHTRAEVKNPIERAWCTGMLQKQSEQTLLLARDGTEWPVEESGASILDEAGHLLGSVLVFREISERRATELALRDTHSALEQTIHERTAALRESEEAFRAIFEQSSVCKIEIDSVTGRFLRVNTACCQFTGYPESELLQRTLKDITHPADMAVDLDRYSKVGGTEAPEPEWETRFIRPDGSITWGHITLNLIHGGAERLIGVIQDINEQKRAKEDLRESRERIAADLEAITCLYQVGNQCMRADMAFQQCMDGILDAAIVITKANKGNIQLLGAESGELRIRSQVGFEEPFLNFFAGVRDTQSACGAALSSASRVVVEDVTQSDVFAGQASLDILLAAGVHAVQSTPLVSSAGNVVGMISTHYSQPTRLTERELRLMDLLARQAADYLERKQTEEQLRRTANFDEAALKCLGEGLYTIDENGLVTSMNPAAEELFGWTFPELCGKKMHDMTHHHYRDGRPFPACECAGYQVLTHGQPLKNHEDVFIRKDGTFFDVIYSIAPMRDAADQVIGLVVVFSDITQRKWAEQTLREADRRKDEFLATLAHELRNPLAPICSGLEILKLNGSSDANAEKIRAMMERQVNHLIRLVDDLLEVSRITGGKIELRREPIDLSDVIQHAVEISQPLIAAGKHRLTISLPSESLRLVADTVRLTQVLSNLLNNAAKYTEAGGQIEVLARREEGEAIVSIRDSGVGIPADMLPRVFDLFTQVDRTLGRARGGLGIGLAIVRTLVEMHGGRVEAHSAGVNQGSEFIVHLPLANEVNDAVIQSPAVELKTSSKRRILITDDNVDAADTHAMLLKAMGADVRAVYDGQSALNILAEFKPEMILLDIGMPDIDGYETARLIRRHPDGQTPLLVALTGWGQDDDHQRTREAGFAHHLVKPINLSQLRSLLMALEGG